MTIVIAVLAVLVLLLLVGAAMARRDARRPGPSAMQRRFIREREAAIEAQLEVEQADIEEMLDAQAALRERIGMPSLGDELAEEALRDRDEPEPS